MPAWMAKRSKKMFPVDKPTTPQVFLFSVVYFNAAPSNHVRPVPINIDNNFPTIAM